MSRSVIEFRVLIASPGDLPEARSAARDEVSKWNELYSEQQSVRLLPVMWETHSSPEMGDRPQAIINRQMVDSCDIAIGLFWQKIGTPMGESASGTIEELERMIAAGHPTSIYFCTAPVDPYALDSAQFESLRGFHDQCKSRGLFSSFVGVEDLRDQLRRQLSRQVADLQEKAGSEANLAPTRPTGESTAPGTAVLAQQALETEPKEDGAATGWYSLLKRGEYKKGMELLREAYAKGEWTSSTLADMEGFGRVIAFTDGGEYQAFLDLEQEAKANPSDPMLWFWYGYGLERMERTDESLAAMRRVMEMAPTGHNHRIAVNYLASRLFEAGQTTEALDLWRTEIAAEQDPKGRAQYIGRIADMYEKGADTPNIFLATSLRELVLDIVPSHSSRSELAWRYGSELDSPALSLLHYASVLERDDTDGAATLNAGWAAEQMSLPITSVQYYTLARGLKQVLAMTNLGWRYLEAGFAAHAEDMVSAARDTDAASETADRLAVAIRDRKLDETNRWSSTRERASKVVAWRAKTAKAFTSPAISPAEIAGVYSGTPASLQLGVNDAGEVTGTFSYAGGGTQYVLTGAVSGRLIEFSWNSMPPASPGAASLLESVRIGVAAKAGRGYLVVSERALRGYVFRGSESIDPAGLDDFAEWSLERP